jgi:prefoldin subunit 5
MSDRTYDEDDLRRVAGIFSEQISGELQAIHEVLGGIRQQVSRLPAMEADIRDLKSDMYVVKAAVKDTNRELHSITRPGYVAEDPSEK